MQEEKQYYIWNCLFLDLFQSLYRMGTISISLRWKVSVSWGLMQQQKSCGGEWTGYLLPVSVPDDIKETFVSKPWLHTQFVYKIKIKTDQDIFASCLTRQAFRF